MTSNNSDNSTSSAVSWISWCCSLPGHDWFIQVPEAFIEDDFNLINLSSIIPSYSQALDLVLDLESDEELPVDLETNAISLYRLVHARYLTTRAGLQAYKSRVVNSEFGVCPRHGCHSSPLIPTGLSDTPQLHSVKLFCNHCLDIYIPKQVNQFFNHQSKYHTIDGSAFGTTFAHLFFNIYPDLINSNYSIYYPRIFGFKVSVKSPVGPSMGYLRRKIGDSEEMVVDKDESGSDGEGDGA